MDKALVSNDRYQQFKRKNMNSLTKKEKKEKKRQQPTRSTDFHNRVVIQQHDQQILCLQKLNQMLEKNNEIIDEKFEGLKFGLIRNAGFQRKGMRVRTKTLFEFKE